MRKLAGAVCLAGSLVAAPIAAEPVTIAALGDSLTQGYGLPDGEGFVPQLQTYLDEQGLDVEIINAGVSGDTTAGGRARADWTLTPEVDAMIVALGGNDVLRGLDPAQAKANLDAILKLATERDVKVLLVGLTAPGNYGPDYKAEFEAIFPDLAAKYETLLHQDFLGALTRDTDRKTAVQTFMQPDGIHPNAAGVAEIVADIGPKLVTLASQIE